MSARARDATLDFRVRGGLAGVGAALVALLVLALLALTAMGSAGAGWETPAQRTTLVVALSFLSFSALAVGGAVGAWQAAAGGARSRRDAALAGATAPALIALLLSILLALAGSGSVAGGLASGLVMAAGAAFGAWALARRLDG